MALFPEEVFFVVQRYKKHQFSVKRGETVLKDKQEIFSFILSLNDPYTHIDVLNVYLSIRKKNVILQRKGRKGILDRLSKSKVYENVGESIINCMKKLENDQNCIFFSFKDKTSFLYNSFNELYYLKSFEETFNINYFLEIKQTCKDIEIHYFVLSTNAFKRFTIK